MGMHDIRMTIDKAEPELRAAGVSALYLFGSEARGEASANSDVDLAFDVSEEADERFSLIDQARVMLRLQELLGCKVDLVERKGLHRDLRLRIERDMVRLF